ncbi:MAG: uridine kinase, partial [Candidatus Dormibacteraeota bacterium]|nr:uridine kinase [Candidatus Dormibacteraeota bacterium]
MVGIDGSPGAGKTTLAGSLAGLDEAIEVVGLDAFGLPQAALPDAPAETAVDWRRFRTQVLLLLSRDLPGLVPPAREVPVGGIVLVEGQGALIKQLATFYDFRIWVEAPDHVRRA